MKATKTMTKTLLSLALCAAALGTASAQVVPTPAGPSMGAAAPQASTVQEFDAVVLAALPRYETRRIEHPDCERVQPAPVVETQGSDGTHSSGSGWKGAGVGAVVGAIVGQLIQPGSGAAVGAVLGGGVGYAVESTAGRRTFAFGSSNQQPEKPVDSCTVKAQAADVRVGFYLVLRIGSQDLTVASSESLPQGTPLKARYDASTGAMTLRLL